MTFEEGLVKEFTNNNIKIFPLGAPEGSIAPFVVYQKNKLEFLKSLGGELEKANGEYSLVLVCKNYNDLHATTLKIKDILLNTIWDKIGGEGPYIENISISISGDTYVYETDEYTTRISVQVNY